MEAKIVYEVVTKLIGNTEPRGESSHDAVRLQRMGQFIEVFDLMHQHIDDIAYRYKDSKQASVKKIADLCNAHLDKMGIEE